MITAAHGGLRRRLRSRRMRRTGSKIAAAVALAALLLLGGWLWLRDSSLVAVRNVAVTGLSGADAGRIRAALVARARAMTTLDADPVALRAVVAPYPVVRRISVSTSFPHAMRIRVLEQIPVGAVMIGGRPVPVASDGTILHDAGGGATLPLISLAVPPGGAKVTEPDAVQAVALLAAAPYQLLPHVSQAEVTAAHGLTAQLRSGPEIYFGDATDLAAKWAAAAAVLAGSTAAGASYVDVTDPARPATGTTGAGSGAAGAAGSPTSASSPSAATPASPATSAAPATPASAATSPSGGSTGG